MRDPRVFDYFDYVTLDDGERPLLNLLGFLSGRPRSLVRTYVRSGGEVVLENDPSRSTTYRNGIRAFQLTMGCPSSSMCRCWRC